MEKNPAAQALGKLGGLVTKEKGSEYFKQLSLKGVAARKANRAVDKEVK